MDEEEVEAAAALRRTRKASKNSSSQAKKASLSSCDRFAQSILSIPVSTGAALCTGGRHAGRGAGAGGVDGGAAAAELLLEPVLEGGGGRAGLGFDSLCMSGGTGVADGEPLRGDFVG